MSEIRLQKACPLCQEEGSIQIDGDILRCKNEACTFIAQYCCPICDAGIDKTQFGTDSIGTYFNCGACKHQIHLKRIAHMIENGLIIDTKTLCKICHGPTVHRQNANIGHRCFFFPKCSGQATLFGEQKESLVFLDFETTGLEAVKDYITEIGMVKIDEEGFEHTYNQLISVPIPLPEKITKITGITDEMLAGKPSIETLMPKIVEFIGTAKIVCHNAEFDLPWLLLQCEKYNTLLQAESVICTLKWARALGEGQASLGALSRKYKINHQNAHRALADAATTKELFFIYDQEKGGHRPIEPILHYQKIVETQKTQYASIS